MSENNSNYEHANCKELFEYEMTEVLAMLKGEFSAFSGQDMHYLSQKYSQEDLDFAITSIDEPGVSPISLQLPTMVFAPFKQLYFKEEIKASTESVGVKYPTISSTGISLSLEDKCHVDLGITLPYVPAKIQRDSISVKRGPTASISIPKALSKESLHVCSLPKMNSEELQAVNLPRAVKRTDLPVLPQINTSLQMEKISPLPSINYAPIDIIVSDIPLQIDSIIHKQPHAIFESKNSIELENISVEAIIPKNDFTFSTPPFKIISSPVVPLVKTSHIAKASHITEQSSILQRYICKEAKEKANVAYYDATKKYLSIISIMTDLFFGLTQ